MHGQVTCALLHLDKGRVNTATKIAEELGKNKSRHPHLRSLLRHLDSLGQTLAASSEPTGIEWLERFWIRLGQCLAIPSYCGSSTSIYDKRFAKTRLEG